MHATPCRELVSPALNYSKFANNLGWSLMQQSSGHGLNQRFPNCALPNPGVP